MSNNSSEEVMLQYLESIERKIDDLAPRVHRVEKWQDQADGRISMFGMMCAGIGALITAAVGFFKH